MTKKRISKSRKKSYLKRNSRRKSRHTYRRKIKKTRKKNKSGGAEELGLTGLTPREAELVSGGRSRPLPKNLFGNSKTFNVLETLYGGDPIEVGRRIKQYNEEKEKLFNIIWNDDDDDDDQNDASNKGKANISDEDRENTYDEEKTKILNQIFPSGHPTYILISGHGGMIDCTRESGGKVRQYPCFTLLPRGYKLILATATGKGLVSTSGEVGGRHVDKQIEASYYRMYEGLIPNQILDFDLVYENSSGVLVEKKEDKNKYSPGRHRKRYVGTGYVSKDLPGVIITDVKAPSDTRNSFGGMVQGEEKLDYYGNFHIKKSIGMTEILLADAEKVREPGATIPEIEKYADEMVSGTLPLPETQIKDYDMPYSIMPVDKIKEQIRNSVDSGYSGNFEVFLLSQLLKHIEEVGKTNINVPKVIVGSFCRSGDFNYNIDGLINHCKKFGLKPLMKEYFSGNISYEGVDDELRRGTSLASKTKPQDFWEIYDNIASKLSMFAALTRDNFETVRQKIEVYSSQTEEWGVYKGINLSVDDVCLIFQMDQHLQINSR